MDSKVIAKITDGKSYINSLRNRNLTVYLFGEKIEEPVDHDMTRPSINAIAKTFDLALSNPDLAGGFVSTLPSVEDSNHLEIGKLLHKYLRGSNRFNTEERIRILRLIENMTMGINAVGYLT